MLCDNCGNKISCVFNASSTVEKCEMYIPKANTVMSWLEGLEQDDWQDFYSYSEVQSIAKASLKLLKERKHGKWTTHRMQQHDGEWYCDQCDYEPTVFEATPYCPNCGAMMELDK